LYLLIAVAFGTLFVWIGLSVPDAFKGITFEDNPALANSVSYLSFVTLTSTGFGDIVYVFVSERLAPLSVAGYQRMVARAGEAAGFRFLVHSHMLRHSCGYKLANDAPGHPGNPALPWAQVDQLDCPLHGSRA
jgi:Phage integrase family